MNQMPIPLIPGDLIAIVAPAKSIEEGFVIHAKDFFEQAGFRVILGAHCLGRSDYFSGTIGDRLSDFQDALDNPDVKAIVCARGGYGCVQLVDRIKWASQIQDPKWIVGFSDVTFFHQRMQLHGVRSIHGTMPLNFQTNTTEALETLVGALTGKTPSIEIKSSEFNRKGNCSGRLLGGNLSILFSLLGTDDQVDFENSILFIEDLAEPIYHLDRMLYAFEKAGILEKIKGLIVGGMTGMKDTETPFGKSFQEVILSHFHYQTTPIVFDFPAGHIDDNRVLILGADVELAITNETSSLTYN
jgi:muramoyltetrapeptide carboxypeptidase